MWTYVSPGAGTVVALNAALAYAASDIVAHKVPRTVEGRLVTGSTNAGKTWALSYFNRLIFWNDVFLFFSCICCARRFAKVSHVDKPERQCPYVSTQQIAKGSGRSSLRFVSSKTRLLHVSALDLVRKLCHKQEYGESKMRLKAVAEMCCKNFFL